MKRGTIALLCILLLLSVSGCGPSEADLAATDDAIRDTEDAIEETEEAETAVAQQTADMFATQEIQTQAAATAQAGTEQAIASTAEFEATIDAYVATQAQNTLVAQTQEAAHIYDIVQRLYDAGYITQTNGSFHMLPSFDYSMAQIGWFQRVSIPDSEVSDFVLVMNVSWESASRTADFDSSGCGVSYRVSDDQSEFYAFMLALDGNLTFFRLVSGYNYVRPYTTWFGSLDFMQGSETFILVAEGTTYRVFNENLELIDIRDGQELYSGHLEYIISSGTNVDFGTYCSFDDIELWRLDE